MDYSSSLGREDILPETILFKQGYTHVAGVDEAGRGPLAGPVVAAAVILSQNWIWPGIKDSKKLTAKKRESLFPVIKEYSVAWNWAIAEHDEIDRTNILKASLRAMEKAVATLCVKPDFVIIDGPHPIPTHIPQTPIIKGDTKSPAIAAASIMAKVIRDSIMRKYHNIFPQYNFAQHKGYGTSEHISALVRYGACSIHRKSFKRVLI